MIKLLLLFFLKVFAHAGAGVCGEYLLYFPVLLSDLKKKI